MTELEQLQLRVERAKRALGKMLNSTPPSRKGLTEVLHILEGRDK